MTLFEKFRLWLDIKRDSRLYVNSRLLNNIFDTIKKKDGLEVTKIEYRVFLYKRINYGFVEANPNILDNPTTMRIWFKNFVVEYKRCSKWFSFMSSGKISYVEDGKIKNEMHSWNNTMPSSKWMYRFSVLEEEYIRNKYYPKETNNKELINKDLI